MSHITIVGSGNVGANTAFFIAEKCVTDVMLCDVVEGIPRGKSLDLMEAAPIRKYRNKIFSFESESQIEESETVIITAGKVSIPGYKKNELFAENKKIILEWADRIKRLAPEAKVIIATEPVDPLTALFVRVSGLSRFKVMGLGGILDSTRFCYGISKTLGISPENINALIIGAHSDDMIGLPDYSSVSGVPLTQLVDEDAINKILTDTRKAEELIIQMAKRNNSFYAPSAACAELVDSMHMNLNRVFSVSIVLDGEYGIKDAALSLPCVIGADGIIKVLTPGLEKDQIARLKESAQWVNALSKE